MARIAILHYTASPSIGGIEGLIDAQCVALAELGHEVRLIVGSGSGPPGADVRVVPEMLPGNRRARAALLASQQGDGVPARTLAADLARQLEPLLDGCDACWVHNIFTLALHPALTAAMEHLTTAPSQRAWIAWCEDVTYGSRFWDGPMSRPPVLDGVRYVTISAARAAELAHLLRIPPDSIESIAPPIDVLAWLGTSEQTRTLVRALDLVAAFPCIFVPSKLLPHKRLDLAVRACACVAERGYAPRLLVSGAPSPHEPSVSAAVRQSLSALASDLGIPASVTLVADELSEPPTRATMRDLMLLGDVVYLPSAEEGFGVPLIEAAALRAPVVCTDIPAFRAALPTATFVPAEASPGQIADVLLGAAVTPANLARRRALTSWSDFRRTLAALVPQQGAHG